MATPAFYMSVLSALGANNRFRDLFAMSDRQLAARGYDRNGLTRSHIAGIAAF